MGLLVAMLLVAWRLASGPVSISFLTPYIQEALDEVHQGALDVTFDDTILTWAGWERTLDIRIVNLRTALPSGELLAAVPEVSVSLSAQALMKGTVAPRSIEFFGPSLSIVRAADGHFALGLDNADNVGGVAEGSDAFIASMVMVMLRDSDPNQAMSYLSRIRVVAGEVTYEDQALGTTWYAPSADAEFSRADEGLQAELNLDLQAGDKLAEVSVIGTYSPAGKRVDLGVSFDDITPAVFATMSPQMGVLGALDLPLSGTMTLSVEQSGRIEAIGFDVAGASGHVGLPVPVAADLDALAWAQRLEVSNLELSGRYEGAKKLLDISRLVLTPSPGETFYLPAPFDHEMPIKTVSAQMAFSGEDGRLDVRDLTIGVDDAEAVIATTITGLGQKPGEARGLSIDFNATARNVAFDRLARYWPERVGVDARYWVLDSLSKGIADRAVLSLALRPGDDGAMRLVSLAGDIRGHGIDVDYLDTMPPVRNASGSVTFNEKRFDIKVDSGEGAGGLKITSGDIALLGLNEEDQVCELSLDIEGPVPSALKLIDNEPLGFASVLGIKPGAAQGHAKAKVNLHIPLKKDLLASEVGATATAQLSDAGFAGALFDKDLSHGNLDLAVSNDGLELKGEGQLGRVPVQLVWNHDFRDGALFLDRYQVTGHIPDVLNLGELGIKVPAILSRYMQGAAAANVSYTEMNDGRQSLSARVDLAEIRLSAPELGWDKPAGVPGTAVLELRLSEDKPREIPKFSVTAPDMDISGSATFLGDGTLERIDLDTMRSGHTDVAGSLTPAGDNVWEVVLRGESLDAGALWDEMIGIRQAERDAAEIAEDDLIVNAAVDIRTLMIREDRLVHDLIGTVYRDHGLWRKMDVVGMVGSDNSVEVLLDTAPQGIRYLSIASDNAGAALKNLDLYDNILGGAFDLKAAYTQPGADAPLEGVAKVTDYAMIEAPAFTKLIGVMSLTGVLDALQGDGLNFDVLDAPFKLQSGILELTQARASGPTLGVTASGRVDMDKRFLDLEGTVVPAYAINALLGNIPVIGELFVGKEKGGGLFAATYTMKGAGENVEITVNPLSALAPGILRDIFTGSDKEKELKKPK